MTPNPIAKLTAILFVGTAACSHVAPKELVDAREAYLRASTGPANELTPAEVHKARVALDLAERAFGDDPDDQKTKDLAYVAQRRAQLAEAVAMMAQDNKDKALADQGLAAKQAQMQKDTKTELASAKEQMAADGRQRTQDATLLSAEKAAREAAEQKTSAAEQKSTDAETRLGQIAEALLNSGNRSLLVEGFTDSRGQEARNLDLSQRRAEAVRTFIVGKGYPSEMIRATGQGKQRPVADNGNAEGRANNRRVEIVVLPKQAGEKAEK